MPADLQGARTRAPAVAGLFYPRDPVRLQTEVLDLLGGTSPSSKVVPKALIAPHAGYVYSGRVAGAAFAKLRANAQAIARVVLIGPAHYVSLGGIAAPRVEAFETPLGRVLVDTETCSQIGCFEFVTQTDTPHVPEHALEVELPFLQTVLSSFQLVPLVVGDASPQEVAHLLRQLWNGPETLIVVSSDLSHYNSYETAQRLDLSTAEAIEQGEWGSLGSTRACGWLAVAGAPRTWGIPARAVQLRRYGRFARSCGRIWGLDVRGDGLIGAGQTGRSRLYLMIAQRALSSVSAENGF